MGVLKNILAFCAAALFIYILSLLFFCVAFTATFPPAICRFLRALTPAVAKPLLDFFGR